MTLRRLLSSKFIIVDLKTQRKKKRKIKKGALVRRIRTYDVSRVNLKSYPLYQKLKLQSWQKMFSVSYLKKKYFLADHYNKKMSWITTFKISLWHEMSVLAIVYRSNAYKIRGKSAILMDFSISVDLSDKWTALQTARFSRTL